MTTLRPDARPTQNTKRSLAALENPIADSRDPSVEAYGARHDPAHALDQVSPNELPLDEEGFASQHMGAENFRKLFDSARDRADNLAERVKELPDEPATARTEALRPSADRQAIYFDEHDRAWCDYPADPGDDQVLQPVEVRDGDA